MFPAPNSLKAEYVNYDKVVVDVGTDTRWTDHLVWLNWHQGMNTQTAYVLHI